MPTVEDGLGLQEVLHPDVAGDAPMSICETTTGDLLLANGIDPMLAWSPPSPQAEPAGVDPPKLACELGALDAGMLCGQYLAFVRYIDRRGRPSDLSPASNAIDCGRDGHVEAMARRDDSTVFIRSEAHGLVTGDPVVIEEVQGPGFGTCNGIWSITVLDADSFTIPLLITSGEYERGGHWTFGVRTLVYGAVPVPAQQKVVRKQILRNLAGNADVFYVDVDTEDLQETVFLSDRTDEELSTCEAVPLVYGEDEQPYANRHAPPPGHKSCLAIHRGRAFAAGEVTYRLGHAEATFGSSVVRGVGTRWVPNFAGRMFHLEGAARSYEIAAVDPVLQEITLVEPVVETPRRYSAYAIRPAVGERRIVYYSEPGDFESWPAFNGIALPEDSDEVTGLMVMHQFLYVLEHRHIYRITGQEEPSVDGFVFLTAERGCLNDRCHVTVEGTCYMLDEAGIHAFDGQDVASISDPIQSFFGLDASEDIRVDWAADRRFWHAAHDPVRATIRWFLAVEGGVPLCHAVAFNYRQKRFWIEEYPRAVTSSCVATVGYRRSLAGTEGRRVVCLSEGELDGIAAGGTIRGRVASADAVTLTDPAASFAAYEGAPVAIVSGLGRGQVRIVAANTDTVLTLRDPWGVVPDRTSLYQVGGIPWTWRSGWFRFEDDEADNPRDVELVYEPLGVPTVVGLLLYFDHEREPRSWAYSQADDGGTIEAGSPWVDFRLDTSKGIASQRMVGHADVYAGGDRYVAVELRGVQGGEPVRIYEVTISGVAGEG